MHRVFLLILLAFAACESPARVDAASAAPTSTDLRPTSREAQLAAEADPTWSALLQLLAERADRKAVQQVDFPRRATCRIDGVEIQAAVDALDVGATRVRLWTSHPLRFDRTVAGVLIDELAARLGLPAPPLRAAEGS